MNYPNNHTDKNNLLVTNNKDDHITENTNPCNQHLHVPIHHLRQFKLTKLIFVIKIKKKFFPKILFIMSGLLLE